MLRTDSYEKYLNELEKSFPIEAELSELRHAAKGDKVPLDTRAPLHPAAKPLETREYYKVETFDPENLERNNPVAPQFFKIVDTLTKSPEPYVYKREVYRILQDLSLKSHMFLNKIFYLTPDGKICHGIGYETFGTVVYHYDTEGKRISRESYNFQGIKTYKIVYKYRNSVLETRTELHEVIQEDHYKILETQEQNLISFEIPKVSLCYSIIFHPIVELPKTSYGKLRNYRFMDYIYYDSDGDIIKKERIQLKTHHSVPEFRKIMNFS